MEKANQNWAKVVQVPSSSDIGMDIYPLFSGFTIYLEDFSSVLKTIREGDLLQTISNDFGGLSLDLNKTLQNTVANDNEDITIEKLLLAASEGKLQLVFTNGKIKYSKDNIDSIASIPIVRFAKDTIEVVVNGDAFLAEEAIKRISILLYDKASLKRTWRDIEKSIYSKDWRVSVEVDMGMSVMEFVHPEIQNIFLTDQNSPIKQFGSKDYNKKGQLVDHEKKIYIEPEINFKINILDVVSGIIESSTIEFDRLKSFQRGTGIMRVTANCDMETLKITLKLISEKLRNNG